MKHHYAVTVRWNGNTGSGTSDYRSYRRDHEIEADGKSAIAGSSDPTFRGDKARWNPEELLVASLSACHQLAYLHLCADAGITVLEYEDRAAGTMVTEASGAGRMVDVLLSPSVTIAAGGDPDRAHDLHERAHELCFIANSVSFPVRCEPSTHVRQA